MTNNTLSNRRYRIQQSICLLVFLMAFTTSFAIGQDVVEKQAERSPDSLRAVQIQQQVKPAFLIQPLVHRLEARRGQLLRFSFSIENNKEQTRLEMRPVAMMQRENGVIMPDPETPEPGIIKLTSASAIELSEGESHEIQGQLRVPPTNSPFLSYGVLVKEIPAPATTAGNDSDDTARVGIRFITQYLLRVDISVLGTRGDSIQLLELSDAGLQMRNGKALAQLHVTNPTDTPMEYGIRCHLEDAAGRRSNSTMLAVPVRSNQPLPERYEARILASSKLRMEEFLPEAIFPGEYQLMTELLHHGRVMKKQSFPVVVRSGDFPAQDATIIRVARDITVQPPAVELSVRKGGKRIQSFTVNNGSLQTIKVNIQPEARGETECDWLTIRPDNLELKPGQQRKVLVSLAARKDFEIPQYAFASVSVTPETGEAIGTQRVPVALLTNGESLAKLTPQPLQWQAKGHQYGFVLPVRNDGNRHVSLNASLSLADEFGRGFLIESGYGRWLLPGDSDELSFRFRQLPPPGNYQVEIAIDQGEGVAPLQIQQGIRLASPLEERLSEEEKNNRARR